MPSNPREKGQAAENLALEYLQGWGLKLISRNFSGRRGEIDLIMLDGTFVVFVEVRARRSKVPVHPLESIDTRKIRKIILTSQQFLQAERKYQASKCRFDVVCITGTVDEPNIEWIKGAFDA